MENLTNNIYGRYTVISYSHSKAPHHYWWCKCECGVEKIAQANKLKNGHTKSCGCLNSDTTIARNKANGRGETPLYKIWRAMISRCYNIKNDSYKDYGGRGIIVCDEWKNDKKLFYVWAKIGYKNGLSIERVNVHGNYEPSNCTWIPRREQPRNTTLTKLNLTKVSIIRNLYKMGAFTVTELAGIYGVSIGNISLVVNNKAWV